MQTQEQRDAFEALIASLPKTWQQILRLRYELDFTFREIAAVGPWPLGSVKAWHHRSLHVLRSGPASARRSA